MPDLIPYMKQLDAVPQEQALSESQINYANRTHLPELLTTLGLDLQPGSQIPESNGVPRMFILDERAPNSPRTLAQQGVTVGSADFWALMQQGRLFAFPAGKKEPVQLQLKGKFPPRMSYSEPLSTDPAKLASRGYEHPKEPPEPAKLPRQVARPGFFARIMHALNKNWYKAEHDAYNTYLEQRRTIQSANRTARESYEQEVAAARQAVDTPCKAVSEGIAAAYGAGRTAQVFQAEREQMRLAQETRQQARDLVKKQQALQDAQREENRPENSVKNMMSIYAPRPQALPELVSARCYTEESFQRYLKPIQLPGGLAIGDTPVDDRLFANIALHAQLEKNIARQWYCEKNDIAPLLDEGLTQQQVDEVLVHKSGGMFIGDVLQQKPRADFNLHFEHRAQPGRERAENALLEYQRGNKAPLAEIIARSAVYVANSVKEDGVTGDAALIDAKLTCELLDLLDEDPELRQAAEEKGLTEKVEESCRGMDEIRKLDDRSKQAVTVLRKAHAEGRELSEQEKTECAAAIIKANTVMAMMKEQSADINSKNYMTVSKRIQERSQATNLAQRNGVPVPQGIKPLGSSPAVELTTYYKLTLKPVPSTLGELVKNRDAREDALAEGGEPEPDSLDRITDMTVKGLGLDKLDTGTLTKKLTSDGLAGKNLLAEQGKLMAAQERIRLQQEAERKREQEMQEKLNNAMNMGHGGKPG